MNVQEKEIRAGSLEQEINEIMGLDVEEQEMVYSFTITYTPFLSIACC